MKIVIAFHQNWMQKIKSKSDIQHYEAIVQLPEMSNLTSG
jgi:hypothetical protein